jgi:uncharacterized protein (DUF433 family)
MTLATFSHIDVDDKGVARIAGSRIKVIHLVMEKSAYGWGPEEMLEQFPHLSLAKIHAAFAYYYDHKAELDEQIQKDFLFAEAMRQQAGESPLAKKLRAIGKDS